MGSRKQNIIFSAETSEFKNNIDKAKNSIKTLNAELKVNQSLLKGNSTNIEDLKERLSLLNQKYEQQSTLVENLKAKYEKAVEVYGENSKEAQSLYNAYKNEEAALINLRNEIDRTNTAIKLQENTFKKLGENLQTTGKVFEKLGDKISSVGDRLSKFSAVASGGVVAVTKSAIDFESAFTGVTKTVEGTDEQLAKIRQGIIDMSTEMPASAKEIAGVAEAAGQLGIKTDDILNFSKVMMDLGNSTNLSADEAASSLAKFANITNMSADNYSRLGSTIVDLGNNFATTESDIVAMGTRLAATGELAGLSEPEIMALATAMSSVGIEAEAGGSAMSKLLQKMSIAVETGKAGNLTLSKMASVAGMTGKEFKKAFQEDSAGALAKFIDGLQNTERNGKSAIAILQDLGLTDVRLSNTILSLSNSNGIMTETVETANKAWDENVALSNEANKRYGTTESQMTKLKNKVQALAISTGDQLLPTVNSLIESAEPLIQNLASAISKFNELDDSTKQNIIKMGAFAIAVGPVLSVVGRLTSGIGSGITALGTFTSAIGVMQTGVQSANATVNGLATVLTALTSTAGLTVIGITAVIGVISAIAIATQKSNETIKNSLDGVAQGAANFTNGIGTAKSHLSEFNSTLFASSEQQMQLQANMQEVQDGITSICRTATEERRNYTAEEITQLETYFQRLNDLQVQEMDSQMAVSGAIITQSKLNIENFSGNIDEFKVQAQEWLNTSIEQKDNIVKLAEEQCTTKIALLTQQYDAEGRARDENYNAEVQKAYEQKQAMVDAANQQVAEVSLAYTNGYQQLGMQQDGFYAKYQETNANIESENQRHTANLESIQNAWYLTESNKLGAREQENYRHENELKKIWKQMYKDLDETQQEQLGTWIAMCAQTELYGGQMDEKSKTAVTNIAASWDELPPKTTKSMTDAMQGMLNGMSAKESELYAKAQSIANNIINIINSAFDVHSPSRVEKKTFENVIEGGIVGLEHMEGKIYSTAERIAEGIKERLDMSSLSIELEENLASIKDGLLDENLISDGEALGKDIVNNLSPKSIVVQFYPQQMTDVEMQRAEKYIREKWGAEVV